MKSWDYEAVVYAGAIYCVHCLPGEVPENEVSPIFADSEWDCYPVCDRYHREHDYMGLTSDGLKEFCRRQMAEKYPVRITVGAQ